MTKGCGILYLPQPLKLPDSAAMYVIAHLIAKNCGRCN